MRQYQSRHSDYRHDNFLTDKHSHSEETHSARNTSWCEDILQKLSNHSLLSMLIIWSHSQDVQIHLKMWILCRNKLWEQSMLSQEWRQTQLLLKLQWHSLSMSRIMQKLAESQRVCNSCIQQSVCMLCCECEVKHKKQLQLKLNHCFNQWQEKDYHNRYYKRKFRWIAEKKFWIISQKQEHSDQVQKESRQL